MSNHNKTKSLLMFLVVLVSVYILASVSIALDINQLKSISNTRIPRIIHYIWLGANPKTEQTLMNIATWRRMHPNWLIVEWNDETILQLNNAFINEALEMKKYAFAADVLRTVVVLLFGGIYVDSDVVVTQPLDSFLNHSFFIGRDPIADGRLEPHLFGGIENHIVLEQLMLYYHDRHFIKKDGSLDQTLMPLICGWTISRLYNISLKKNQKTIVTLPDNVTIYPYWYFGRETVPGLPNYAIHQCTETWKSSKYRVHHFLSQCYDDCKQQALHNNNQSTIINRSLSVMNHHKPHSSLLLIMIGYCLFDRFRSLAQILLKMVNSHLKIHKSQ